MYGCELWNLNSSDVQKFYIAENIIIVIVIGIQMRPGVAKGTLRRKNENSFFWCIMLNYIPQVILIQK